MVRMLLLATFVVTICGCGPFQAKPPCTKTGADSYGTPFCPLSAAQVKALPEAQLVYPGSTTLWSATEGGALSVNGIPASANVRSAFNTSATPSQVRDWYDRTLRATGWTKTNDASSAYVRHPPISTYCETYYVDVSASLPYGSPASPPPAGGSYYQVTFQVPSTVFWTNGTPDTLGKEHFVTLPCGVGHS
jgi:hypothetical protein